MLSVLFWGLEVYNYNHLDIAANTACKLEEKLGFKAERLGVTNDFVVYTRTTENGKLLQILRHLIYFIPGEGMVVVAMMSNLEAYGRSGNISAPLLWSIFLFGTLILAAATYMFYFPLNLEEYLNRKESRDRTDNRTRPGAIKLGALLGSLAIMFVFGLTLIFQCYPIALGALLSIIILAIAYYYVAKYKESIKNQNEKKEPIET